MIGSLKAWAHAIKQNVHAVWLVARDPRTSWYAKALALAVAGYALSPIDLIPDFIPVLGYLDDMILLPLGILLVIKLVPPDVMAEHRAVSAQHHPASKAAAGIIGAIWLATAAACGWIAYAYLPQ